MKKVPLTLALVALAACAAEQAGRIKLADGSYHLSCKEPLAHCLAKLTDICTRYGYDVVRAREEKRHYGPSLWEAEYISSDAIVRCRSPEALIGGSSAPPPVSSAAPSARPAAAGRCFPGSTQACLGPGACKGAQTCRADGTQFNVCDCGGAAPSTPPAAPEGDGAPDAGASTGWAAPASDAGAR